MSIGDTSGQSYKHFTIVNYDSRVITWGIFKSGRYDSRVVHYDRRGFIRLATVKAFSVGVGLNKNLYILEPTFLDMGSGVAQLVEQLLPTPEMRGSNSVINKSYFP